MKKSFAALLIFIVLLSSCTMVRDAIPSDIMARIVSSYDDIPSAESVYLKGVKEYQTGYLSPVQAGLMYTGKKDPLSELSLLEDYCIRIPDKAYAFEIHILKVKNLSDMGRIKRLLEKRGDMLSKGEIKTSDSELYGIKAPEIEVFSKGKYVFLLATSDNDIAKKVINKIL